MSFSNVWFVNFEFGKIMLNLAKASPFGKFTPMKITHYMVCQHGIPYNGLFGIPWAVVTHYNNYGISTANISMH